MRGRDRAYALTSADKITKSLLSIVFNDRCDMVVPTALLLQDQLAKIAPTLNSPTILRWAEVTLGL